MRNSWWTSIRPGTGYFSVPHRHKMRYSRFRSGFPADQPFPDNRCNPWSPWSVVCPRQNEYPASFHFGRNQGHPHTAFFIQAVGKQQISEQKLTVTFHFFDPPRLNDVGIIIARIIKNVCISCISYAYIIFNFASYFGFIWSVFFNVYVRIFGIICNI